MIRKTFKNGLKVIIEKKPVETVTIHVSVNVGSNNETPDNNGISHFVEHMLFEGTKKRPDARVISNEIESIGGELNAYTSNERTCFYVRVPKNHFNRGIDIISDIIQNPIFDNRKIEKERKIVLKEIKLHMDEPRFYQWILFQSTLFEKLPARMPVYGTVNNVKSITKKELLDYYDKYYLPNNMVISIVGKVGNIVGIVEEKFKYFKKKKLIENRLIKEPKQKKVIKREKRKIFSSYLVLGYKTVPRTNRDSYVLDIIKAILGRGQSGKIFDEIRNKKGLAYEVGVHHEVCSRYGFFAVYLNTDKRNIKEVVRIITNEFKKLENITDKEIKEAKGFLIGQHILKNEDTKERADELGFWEGIKDARLSDEYIRKIKEIKVNDIKRIAKKYLTEKYVLTIIEQEK